MNIYEMSDSGINVLLLAGFFGGILYLGSFVFSIFEVSSILHRTTQRLRRFVGIGIGMTAVVSCITAISFLGAIGPGVFMYLGSLCLTPLLILVILFNIRDYIKIKNTDTPRLWRWGAACTAIAMAAAPIGGGFLNSSCDQLHRQQIQPVIVSLQNYNTAMGYYPDTIEAVIQSGERPTLSCFGDASKRYDLIDCSGISVFTMDNFTGGYVMRYNLATEKWSMVDFLEGDCSFLE